MATNPNMSVEPIGQNVDGSFIFPKSAPVVKKSTPITPESTGIPKVGIPQVPGIQPIVPQKLIDASQPMPEDKTPEAFKAMIIKNAPNGITKDGRKYADISAYEITKMLVDKAPEGITKAGIPYKDYLVKPRNREEAFIASGAMTGVREDQARRDQFVGGIKEDAYKAVNSGVNIVGNLLKQGEIGINRYTGGTNSFAQTGAQQPENIGSAIVEGTSGTTGLLTDIIPATMAAKIGFSALEESPITSWIPKGISKGMEFASKGVQLTGINENDANNIVATLGNLAFLKGGKAGQLKINEAYKNGGIGPALVEAGIQIPQTTIDTALAPLNLSKAAYNKIKDFNTKTAPAPGSDAGFKYETDSGFKGQSGPSEYNAQTSSGVPFTMDQTPGKFQSGKDLVFQRGTNEDLATRSVFPKATKEKGPNAKTQAGAVALQGIEQLYNDNRTGISTADISTMPGGSEAIEQGLEHYGKQIGDLTNNQAVVPVTDIVTTLKKAMEDPKTRYSGALKSLAEDITSIFSDETYKNGVTINDLQDHISTIKSKIFGDYKNVAALYKESSGRAVKDFLDELSNRFDKTIEETSGNLPELQNAKKAYSNYKKIQKDFVASMLVNERNVKGGALSKAGSALGLYELFKNPTLSGIATSIITKTILNEMGIAKSRGGAYESLIRNLDREALARQKTNPKAPSPNPPQYDSWSPRPDSSSMAPERPVSGLKKEPASGFGPVNATPADILAIALKTGKVDIKKAIEKLKDISPEEIAKHPELVKLVEVKSIVEDTDKVFNKYGKLPQKEIDNTINKIEDGDFTDPQKDYMYSELPAPVKKQVQEMNFARDYPEEVEVKGETKKETKTAPTTNETPKEVVSTPEPTPEPNRAMIFENGKKIGTVDIPTSEPTAISIKGEDKPIPKEAREAKPKTPQEGKTEFYTGRGGNIADFTKTKSDTIFFSKNKDIAKYYGGTDSNVTKAHFDTDNFLDLSTKEKRKAYVAKTFTKSDIEKMFPDLKEKNNMTGETRDEFLSRHLNSLINEETFTGGDKQKLLLDKIKSEGHPGVMLKDSMFGQEDTSYVVFDKSIIKPSKPSPLSQKSEVKYSKPDLASEAKKYKSAEEFVKAQGKPMYHGSDIQIKEFNLENTGSNINNRISRQGVFFAPDASGAEFYAKQKAFIKENGYAKLTRDNLKNSTIKGEVTDAYISNNAKITEFDFEGSKDWDLLNAKITELKKQGFDVIKINNFDDGTPVTNQILVVNPKAIKTKQQLVDIFNKSKKSSLPMSAKSEVKYSEAKPTLKTIEGDGVKQGLIRERDSGSNEWAHPAEGYKPAPGIVYGRQHPGFASESSARIAVNKTPELKGKEVFITKFRYRMPGTPVNIVDRFLTLIKE